MVELTIMISAYVFIVGLCIGSFLNVVIYRVPNGVSIAKGRSKCPNCDHTLRPYDLIPVVSYMILRGKCRDCGSKISPRYPLVELATGLMYVLVYLVLGLTIETVLGVIVVSILIAITMIDFDHMIIPDGLVIALAVVGIAYAFLVKDVTLIERLIGIVAISVPLLIFAIIIPDCFGGGDIKMMAAMGIILGWQNTVLAGFIGIVLGGIVGAVILARNRAKGDTERKHMPFGPYLAIGCIVSLLAGTELIDWYIGLLS